MREPHSSISVLWCFSFNAGLVYFCHLPSLLPFIQRLRFQHLHAPSLGTIGICGATSSLCGLWRGFIDDIKRSSTSPHISRLHPERRHAGVSQPNHQGAAARDTRNLARLHPALLEEGGCGSKVCPVASVRLIGSFSNELDAQRGVLPPPRLYQPTRESNTLSLVPALTPGLGVYPWPSPTTGGPRLPLSPPRQSPPPGYGSYVRVVITLEQGCQTYGPRAGSGPPDGMIRPVCSFAIMQISHTHSCANTQNSHARIHPDPQHPPGRRNAAQSHYHQQHGPAPPRNYLQWPPFNLSLTPLL